VEAGKKEAFRLKRFCCEKVKCSEKSCFFKITYFLGKVKKFEHIKCIVIQKGNEGNGGK